MAKTSRKRTNLSLFFAIFLMMITFMSFLILIYYETHKPLVIETKTGKIMATTVTRLGKSVHCFFGIPYAEPPVGGLRFRKAVPKKAFKETLKAFKQPNYCFQRKTTIDKSSEYVKQVLKYIPDLNHYFDVERAEDCLYLNVFVPDSGANKTVMVWIHGGAFISGQISHYDGSILAAARDVIVVTISYRLGVFGFLAANGSELPGNYGLHDQVLALHWIRDNIHAFGGNVDNVVLFGESAGAISVGYHLICPLSRDLFSRAILESGNPLVPMIMADRNINTEATLDLIRALCPHIAATQVDSRGITCLQEANASLLYDWSQKIFARRIGSFLPIEDNDFFAEHPQELVSNRQFFGSKEILIGTNAVEGANFATFGPFGKFPKNAFTKHTFVALLKHNLPEEYSGLAEMAVDYVLDGVSNGSDSTEVWNRYVDIVGDVIFVCPDFVFINHYSAANQTVFYYRFVPKAKYFWSGPDWASGAVHAQELPFVFGIPLVLQKWFSLKEIQLSETLMTVWTEFAKTGNPSHSWIPYTESESLYMTLDVDDSHMTQGFPGFKCNEYYETVIKETRKYVRSGKKISLL